MHAEVVLAKLKATPFLMARNVQDSKENFYRGTSRRRKIRENLGLLVSGRGYLTNIEKTKVFNAAFASVFNDKSRLKEFEVPETCIKVQESLALCGADSV